MVRPAFQQLFQGNFTKDNMQVFQSKITSISKCLIYFQIVQTIEIIYVHICVLDVLGQEYLNLMTNILQQFQNFKKRISFGSPSTHLWVPRSTHTAV